MANRNQKATWPPSCPQDPDQELSGVQAFGKVPQVPWICEPRHVQERDGEEELQGLQGVRRLPALRWLWKLPVLQEGLESLEAIAMLWVCWTWTK